MSKKETVVLLQVLRITNSLEYWMRVLVSIQEEKNKLFEFRNRMETYFVLISIYKESTKEFSNHLAPCLLEMNLSEDVKNNISEYTAWLSNWKEDEYLQVVDRIRNCLRFHMDRNIYKKYLNEGNESKDLLVGVADGDRYMDFLYTEPYTFEFQYIAEIVPDIAGQNKIDWIHKRTGAETSRFVKLLRKIIYEMLKDNAYKKTIDI